MKRGEPFNVLRDRNSWSNAPRAEAIVAAVASSLVPGTFAYAAAVTLVSVGLSLVTSWAVSALTPTPPTPKQSLLVNVRDAAAPQDFAYGRIRKGGTITYYESTDDNKVLHQIICLAGHEVNFINNIYINDEVVTLSDDSYSNSAGRTGAGWVLSPTWSEPDDSDKHEIRIFMHRGNQTSQSDTFQNSSTANLANTLVSETANDLTNFVGKGIAYLYVRYQFDNEVFANGMPLITADISGKKVEDPRTSTVAYTDNAALCIRDYLRSAYGLADSDLDDTSFSAAANICDETVTLAGSGSEKRFTINGVIRADQSYGDVLQELTTACAGTLFWGGGKWKLTVGAYSAPVKDFTLDDLRSNISLSTRTNLRDQFNKVQGVFTDASQRWIPADYPPIVSAPFIAEDGGVETALNLDLPFTTSAATAQRLAKMTLFRGREQMTFVADFGLSAFDVEVGDIISLTMDRYGWTEKEFEVVGWRFGANDEAGDLRVSLTLRETSQAAFDWNAEESDIIGNNSNLPDLLTGLTISNLTASGGGRTQGDGTFINSAILSWTAAPSGFVVGYEVQWKAVADSSYSSTTTSDTTIEISPLVDGVEYIFRVRAVTSFGNHGPFATVTFTGGGDTTAPGIPTSVTATGGFRYITINWTNPADSDFNYVEVFENSTNSLSGAVSVGRAASNQFVRTNLGISETKWYFLRSVDYSGNQSGFTAGVEATTTFIDDPDFENGIRTLFEEQNLFAIEDVASLPPSGTTIGQQVFNRSDGKLYRWTGTVWEAVAADAAIAPNSITNTEIADDAIDTPQLRANAITASKIGGGTITGDKIQANTITGGLMATSGIITNSAQINNGLITNAKIGNLAVTTAKIQDLAVDTIKVKGGAISRVSVASGTFSASASVTIPEAGWVTAIATFTNGTGKNGHTWRLYIDGVQVQSESPIEFTVGAMTSGRNLSSGFKTVTVECDQTTGDGRCGVTVFGLMR